MKSGWMRWQCRDLQSWDSGRAIVVWLLMGALLLAWALTVTTPRSERIVYSDQATHVMIASSVWLDGDIEYTLEDLKRFREDYPKAGGPYGSFLKQNAAGALYFAKPYLYGVVAAPFYGLFNVDGFIILNALCLVAVGMVTGLAVGTALGQGWGLFASAVFVIPSAFLPWVFVPHPDLFIAALLALGGGLMLCGRASRWHQVLGAVVLGAALHEKIPFVFVIPFVIVAMPAASWMWRGGMSVTVVLSWLLFSSLNIAIDGSFLSYQGLRLYAAGNPFPLEPGWTPPVKEYTSHVFDPRALVFSILGNLSLLEEKWLDFLVGRQTGIIPYFAAGFALLLGRLFLGFGRALWVLAGLFAYLGVQWLAFPTNGYGGAGSYGSRYLLQALPLIPLSYMGVCKPFRIDRWVSADRLLKILLAVSAVFALSIQYRIFLHGNESVFRHYTANIEPPINSFRLERSLLPTTFSGASSRYVDEESDGRVRIFRVDETRFGSWLRWVDRSNESSFVLYKDDLSAPFPPIEIRSPIDTWAKIEVDGTLIWSGMLSGGQPKVLEVESAVAFSSAFDLLLGRRVGFSTLKVKVDQFDRYTDGTVRKVSSRFQTDPALFEGIGEQLSPRELAVRGAELRTGWSHLEPWGVWSDGSYADISLRVGPGGRKFEVDLGVHAYVPPKRETLEVDFLCTGSEAQRVVFRREQFETVRLTCEKRPQDEYVVVSAAVWDPTSPKEEGRGPDPRRLGVGLHMFRMERFE